MNHIGFDCFFLVSFHFGNFLNCKKNYARMQYALKHSLWPRELKTIFIGGKLCLRKITKIYQDK